MSIKMDWEVESAAGLSKVDEDPRDIEARRRQSRRIRIGVAASLVIASGVGGVIAYRLSTVAQQVQADLEATVAAETLALRISDREAYLANQAGTDSWRRYQQKTFERYQMEAAQVEITGQIMQMDISSALARVILREVYNGTNYNVLWFYRHDATGWKHIAPDPAFWGEWHEYHSAYFDFSYCTADQALVDVLAVQLDSWWETACSSISCEGEPKLLQVINQGFHYAAHPLTIARPVPD